MVRIKRSVNSKKSRRKTMKQAKGYTGARSRTLRAAKEQVMHAGADSFTHRKDKKGDLAGACTTSGWAYKMHPGETQNAQNPRTLRLFGHFARIASKSLGSCSDCG